MKKKGWVNIENKDDDIEYEKYKKRLFEFLDRSIAFDKQTTEMREKEYSTICFFWYFLMIFT